MKNPCKLNEIWDHVKKKCVPLKNKLTPIPVHKGPPSKPKPIPNHKGTTPNLRQLIKVLKKGGVIKSKKKK